MAQRRWCEACGSLNLGSGIGTCHACGHDVLTERVMMVSARTPAARAVLAAGAIGVAGLLAACPPGGDIYGGPPIEDEDVTTADTASVDAATGSGEGSAQE